MQTLLNLSAQFGRGARQLRCTSVALAFSALFTHQMIAKEPEETAANQYHVLSKLAQERSAQSYIPQPEVPASVKDLTYDQFRYIGFRDGKEIWSNTTLPFRFGFYHKGYVHVDDVKINVVSSETTQPVPFSKDYFHYLENAAKLDIPHDVGFAGFRVKGTFPDQSELSEIFSFVGASYFRARTARSVLGTSTRGLAIDCGLPKAEEFPVFREYWIVEPRHGDESLHVLALLDSPSVTGAYAFILTPGTDVTSIDVQETLYFRQVPEKVGLAPMSSMWLWGDSLPGPDGDHRPEVHDADGLQINSEDGTWLWRALGQQTYPSLVQFKADNLKGFGLLQRDINPEHYLDDEALYHQRPSVWVRPKKGWESGRVELLELPAPHEGIDNIAVWWVPEKEIKVGEPLELSYQLSYFLGDLPENDLGKAVAHRVTRNADKTIKVEIDFRGPLLAEIPEDQAPVAEISSIRGEVLSTTSKKLPSGNWTYSLLMRPTEEGPFELRISLKNESRVLTETWAYLCSLTAPEVALPPWKVMTQETKESGK
ncbi:glucan biosynthesis protein [Planctomicrobium sp. SH668]|uniref:glucan biosynthesis protein n=1 Tax=Planctomicrobium sp. SH668 TaxID=3448126 RepID=UPI003F5BB680